ncbi:MAG TPA: hypothetical protein VFX92_13545, partial [Candidatus Krumholzibacteria bacterium]|nr:hypothetical protein [Candidatus Krumholzibacteria bacterium]
MRHWILRRAALPLLALLLATVNVSRVAAQSCEEGSPAAYINLQENEPTFACQLPFPVGLVTVNVIVRAIPFQKIRFKLVDPPLGTVVGETWNGTASGDRVNGIEIDMGGCTGQELILVGTLTIIQPGDTAPCT